ncbi:predicted protein [Nematostella vectensis]|uniref:Coiled-coil domain-containing protein 9 n=2 Tax=Nematostella vectensis TaxID=45351 RepID=A7SJ70_NEMVE|nr:coiled-coil domain-containing protein 9 isoform X2 [Nematostella vectensis]EDO36245.1 predicted protein [Nematostella vectensis]|eukprot:XP_001628308.1 predicted protein [Nematostella vectensis]
MAEVKSRGRGRGRQIGSKSESKPGIVCEVTEKLKKEALLEERIRKIREKNEQLLKRQQEIEDDIKHAEEHSKEIAREEEEKAPLIGQKMTGVRMDEKPPSTKGRARGRVLAKMSREVPRAHVFEEKRKRNIEVVEREIKMDAPPSGRNFLADDHRADMSKAMSRSSHSWGGNQFESVVDRIKKDKLPHRSKGQFDNPEISMTGKSRREYMEWKQERERVDQERKERQKRGGGWKREWDQYKVPGIKHDSQEQTGFQDRGKYEQVSHRGKRHNWNYHDDRGVERQEFKQHHKDRNDELSGDWESTDKRYKIPPKADGSVPLAEDWEDTTQSNEYTVGSNTDLGNKKPEYDQAKEKLDTIEKDTLHEETSRDTQQMDNQEKYNPQENIRIISTQPTVDAHAKDLQETDTRAHNIKEDMVTYEENQQTEEHKASEVTDEDTTPKKSSLPQRQEQLSEQKTLGSMTKEESLKEDHEVHANLPEHQPKQEGQDYDNYPSLPEQRLDNDDDKHSDEQLNKHPSLPEQQLSNDHEKHLYPPDEQPNKDDHPSLSEQGLNDNYDKHSHPPDEQPNKDDHEKHPHLAKLVVKQEEGENEFPDFLKTPKSPIGNWADYEVDEEELKNIPIEWVG